jgi:hypothetical protein
VLKQSADSYAQTRGFRLAVLENAMQQLITANAYISTLGGGYFMCKQIGNAKVKCIRPFIFTGCATYLFILTERSCHPFLQVMAKLQMAIAHGLGSRKLASQCRLHYAYNDIQVGWLWT